MNIENSTPAQQSIIKQICITQLDSLRRLLHNEEEDEIDLEMLLIENEISKEEYYEQLEKNIEAFTKVTRNPDDLRVLTKKDRSMFRHILAQLEDRYNKKYPKAVSNLWQRLILIENMSKSKSFTYNMN